MTNEVRFKQDTTYTWSASAASPDYNVEMASLASGSGVVGPVHDFSDSASTMPFRVRISLEVDFASAPTAGNTVDMYMATSYDSTDYDGEVSGASAAFSDEDDAKRLQYVGSLSVSNSTCPQRTSWVWFPIARYGCPVVMNQSGQAFTATGSDQMITITPLPDEIQ